MWAIGTELQDTGKLTNRSIYFNRNLFVCLFLIVLCTINVFRYLDNVVDVIGDYIDGTLPSSCFKPCLSTKVSKTSA